MSDYGINLKLNLEGNNKLRTLYQDFKNLETQINKTTGQVIYIDNRKIVTRDDRQKEDIKIILEF